jgi:RND superfamily putative drug exporter
MILILAVVFGLSMDYEVFLLSRIREEWDLTHDNRVAVASGMQHTGGIITSAALLFLVVVAAFSMASITIVKLIGVGMFVAVVVDAALVRSLLVPATMRFMGSANWWLPPFLAGLHARMDLRERSSLAPAGATVAPPRLPDEQPFPYALHWEDAGEEPAPEPPPAPRVPPAPVDAHEAFRPPAPSPAEEPPQLVFRSAAGTDPNGRAPAEPWRPWADGPPQPRPRHDPRVRRAIVPAPDGSGWRWSDDDPR